MARSDVYIQAGNDNTQTAIGGRKTSRRGWAWLNTDNGSHNDCGIRVRASVSGDRGGKVRATCDCGYKYTDNYDTRKCPECGRQRGGIDTRKSHFQVELPAQTDADCEVEIVAHGHDMAQLARVGVGLCVLKGVMEQAQGKAKGKPALVKQGKMTIKAAMGILGELEEEANKTLPTVMLPGGVTLAHALACVEVCRRLATGKPNTN